MHTEKLILLDEVESTNNYAMGLVHEGLAQHGMAVFSNHQTGGKGRRNKQWDSERGKNITLSIITDMQTIALYRQFDLSIIAALSSYEFLKKYTDEEIKLKWPNDIFFNDSKAGGILIENVVKGNVWEYAVTGIGININQTLFYGELLQAISLKQITGKDYDVVELVKELIEIFLCKYDELKQNGIGKMFTEYKKVLFKLNEKVKLKKGNAVFETIIKGVTPYGQLITFDNAERRFDFDEVEWVI